MGMLLATINHLCKQLDISILYQSQVGIKCFNQLVSSDMFDYFTVGEIQLLPPEFLFLGFDGLKDSQTLINTKVLDSPHFELVQMLKLGKNVANADYLRRTSRGTLDMRGPRRVSRRHIHFIKNQYEEKIRAIQSGNYKPVKIIQVAGQYFIEDGKHTAACCALLGIEAKCARVSTVIYDSFFIWLYKKMLKNRKNYSKNIEFFEAAFRESDSRLPLQHQMH
jgi:hypothetical protein